MVKLWFVAATKPNPTTNPSEKIPTTDPILATIPNPRNKRHHQPKSCHNPHHKTQVLTTDPNLATISPQTCHHNKATTEPLRGWG